MSDCLNCPVEKQCGYEYKPCDCVHQRKFKPIKEKVSEMYTLVFTVSHGLHRKWPRRLQDIIMKLHCELVHPDNNIKNVYMVVSFDTGGNEWSLDLSDFNGDEEMLTKAYHIINNGLKN